MAYANAKDWANNPALQGAFDWIANNPNDPNQIPQRGDIVIFNGNQPGSGGYGHIDIWDMSTAPDNSTWQGLDQNWGGQYVHFVPNHVYTYVMGWWRVKSKPAPAPPPPPPPPAPTPIPAPKPQPDPEPSNPVPVNTGTPPIQPPPDVPPPTPEPTPDPSVKGKAILIALLTAIAAIVAFIVSKIK